MQDAVGVEAKLWFLVVMLVINSVIGLFYYLRIIMAMTGGGKEAAAQSGTGQPGYWSIGGWTLAAVTLLVLWIGLNPEPLIRVVRAMVVGM